MPQLRPESWYVGILLLCVPLQYLFVQYWGNNAVSRTNALKQLFNDLGEIQTKYLEWQSWKRWLQDTVAEMKERRHSNSPENVYPDNPNDPYGESPAVEVMKFKQKQSFGYFGGSPHPRYPRPSHVKYRVGQVVYHKLWNYKGVIIGWDQTAKAPERWLKQMHGEKNPHWRNMPNYAILVDSRDRNEQEVTYVPEENIKVLKNAKIVSPKLDDYFEKFDGTQYVPRPWLKAIYPED